MRREHRKGQVSAELAVLFTFAVAAFVLMGFYLQRAAQGSTKANTDSIGQQFSTDSPWNNQTTSNSYERGIGVTLEETETTSISCSTGAFGSGAAPGIDPLPATDCDPVEWATDPDAAATDTILTKPSTP